MPRFDEPNFTIAPDGITFPASPALPDLLDAEVGRVDTPSPEPLVPIAHRRVRCLANYWHAGWTHAIPESLLRASVAERLYGVADSLPERFGLAVFDAWRPLHLQRELYEVAIADPTIEPGLMAPPDTDPAAPPPHLSGGAVDLTLTFDGQPLALGTGFDDVTARAHTACLEGEPGPAREGRRMLFAAMTSAGFVVFDAEWWHFEHGTRRWAALRDTAPRYGATAPS